MINKLAPVIIPTLNRIDHFKVCVESLLDCDLSEKTDLYVALDYPLHDKHRDGWLKINEYLKTLSGFKSITIIKRDINFGSINNTMDARDFVLRKHESFIYSEDDNEFAKGFLTFMNSGLTKYKNNPKVFSINGYVYPHDLNFISSDVFGYDGFSAWGWATWRDRYRKVSWDVNELANFLDDPGNRRKVTSKILLKNLCKIIDSGVVLGDAFMSFHQIKNGSISVFPKVSQVRNHGHDGTGVNCGNDLNSFKKYSNQKLSNQKEFYFPENIDLNERAKLFLDGKLNTNLFLFYILRPTLLIKKLMLRFTLLIKN
jgi:hypothetical protein